MIICPKCGEKLEASLDEDAEVDYEEVKFECVNGHSFFYRIDQEDLVED